MTVLMTVLIMVQRPILDIIFFPSGSQELPPPLLQDVLQVPFSYRPKKSYFLLLLFLSQKGLIRAGQLLSSLGLQGRGRVSLACEVRIEMDNHGLEGAKAFEHLLIMAPALDGGAGPDCPVHLDVDLPYPRQGHAAARPLPQF